MEAFQSNGATYNLLNSAIIELFDFIRQENIKTLIKYVVDRFDSVFKSIDYVSTFRMLHLKYEQNLELEQTNGVLSRSNSVTALTTSGSHSDMDEDDESYFNESDDDDNNNNTTTTIPVPTTQITVLTQTESQILDDEKNNQIANNQHTNTPNIATNGNLNHKKQNGLKMPLVDYDDNDEDNNDVKSPTDRSPTDRSPTDKSPTDSESHGKKHPRDPKLASIDGRYKNGKRLKHS